MAKTTVSKQKEQTAIHAFDLLDAKTKLRVVPHGLVAVQGPDRFLRREVVHELSSQWMGEAADFPLSRLQGKEATWRDVHDQICTPSLFGPPLGAAVVEDADEFVKKWRSQLEVFAENCPARCVLVLDVESWPANTRLHRIVGEHGAQIRCCPPETANRGQIDRNRLTKWIEQRAKQQHGVNLPSKGAALLLDLAGLECGRLDQELAKLAVWGDGQGQVTLDDIQQAVGGWRAQTTWDMLEAACQGNAPEALTQLGRLLQAGEAEMAIFGSMSWTLRRFAAATRRVQEAERDGKKAKLTDMLLKAGFKNWPVGAVEKAANQLIQIGRVRGGKLYQRLLETDVALKGSHSQPDRARVALELLILELAQQFRLRTH
ncbi:MAG: DNA polymerase III subunit delta [Planctomycetota bacterium]|nr:DNA polymerase III subunit delta [Planctomycetota bacterium]